LINAFGKRRPNAAAAARRPDDTENASSTRLEAMAFGLSLHPTAGQKPSGHSCVALVSVADVIYNDHDARGKAAAIHFNCVARRENNYFDPVKGHFNQRTWPSYLLTGLT
jgi:hypothetical protein